ncbi:MAG: MFS transporter [Hyphomicrobiales bacterium]|nr:MFS transporter [Hyphomicrobiales bacterium]
MFIIALFFCGFSSAIANRTLDPLTVEIARDLAVPVSSVALLASALSFMYAAGQPFIGPLGDHFGKSRVLKLAMWVCAASVLASAFAPNFTVLLAIRPITGLAAGGIVPVGMALLGDLYGPANRQIVLARFIMAAIIGQMAGALLAGSLEALVGWRGVLFVCAAIVVVAAAITTWLLPASPGNNGERFSFATAKANYAKIFALPRAWVCFSSSFFVGGLTFGLLPFIAPLLEAGGNGGAREAGFIIAGFGAGAFLLALLLPVVLKIMRRPFVMMTGSTTAGLCLIAYALGSHWSVQVALLTLFGFGFFMQHNSIQAEVSELTPEARTTAFAMHSSALFIGQTIGPAIYGLQIAAIGSAATLSVNGLIIAAIGSSIGFFFLMYHRSLRQVGQ